MLPLKLWMKRMKVSNGTTKQDVMKIRQSQPMSSLSGLCCGYGFFTWDD